MDELDDIQLEDNEITSNPIKPLTTSNDEVDGSDIELELGEGFTSAVTPEYGSQLKGVDVDSFRKGDNEVFMPNEGGLAALESQRADNQAASTYLGKALLTLGTRFVGEVAKMPVSLGILAGETLDKVLGTTTTDADSYAKSFEENGFLNSIDSLTEELANAIPTYERDRNKYGGFIRTTLLNPNFYATQGADAVGFAASFMTPGLAIKALKIGATSSKFINKGISLLTKGERLGMFKNLSATAGGMDLALATSMSTFLESSSESRETMKHLRSKLEAEGNYNAQEIDEKVAETGKNIFISNMAILAGPNLLTNKILLGGFKGAGKTRFSTVGKGLDSSIKYSALTGNAKYAKIAKDLGLSTLSESWEELSQSTADSFFSEKAAKGDPGNAGDILPELLDEYLKTLGTTEGQQAVYLGALMGGIMGGVGAYKGVKNTNKINSTYADNMNKNMKSFSENLANPYKTDEKGDLVFDPHSNLPILDKNKVKSAIEAKVASANVSEVLLRAQEEGDTTTYNQVFNDIFTELVIPYTQVEGGIELLGDQLSGIFDIMALQNSQLQSGSNTEGKSKEKYINELKQKAKDIKSFSDIYANDTKYVLNSLDKGTLSDEEFATFKSIHAISFIETASRLNSSKKQLAELEQNKAKQKELFGEDSVMEGSEYIKLSEKYLNNIIKNSKKVLQEISSTKGMKKELKNFKDAVGKSEELDNSLAKEFKKKKKEAKKAKKQKIKAEKIAKEAKEELIEKEKSRQEKRKITLQKNKEARKAKAEEVAKRERAKRIAKEAKAEAALKGAKNEDLDISDMEEAAILGESEADNLGEDDFNTGQKVEKDYITGEKEAFDNSSEREGKEISHKESIKSSKKEDEEYQSGAKNDTVSKIIGVNHATGDRQYTNISDKYLELLRSFEDKVGKVVSFELAYERQGVMFGRVKITKELLKKGKLTEEEIETLIRNIPLNAVVDGASAPISLPYIKGEKKVGDYKLISSIVHALSEGVPLEDITTTVSFQAGGELNTSEGNKNNILDLEFIDQDINKVEVFKVNTKGELSDKNNQPIGENRGGRKSGSIYLRSTFYKGKEIFINLDTRSISKREAHIVTELLSNVMDKKTTLADVPSKLQQDIKKNLKNELDVIGKPFNEILTSELANFLVYLGESPVMSNHLEYVPDRNMLIVRDKTYSSKLSNSDKAELREFLFSSKDRKVSFHGKGKDNVKSPKYLYHMIKDEILTTNINVGENVSMFTGNINLYIDSNNIKIGKKAEAIITAKEELKSEAKNDKIEKTIKEIEVNPKDNLRGTKRTKSKRVKKSKEERRKGFKEEGDALKKSNKDNKEEKC